MNILYVDPDIPVPHTGDFVGGSTHVLKVADGLAKIGNESENIFRRRVFRWLAFPIWESIEQGRRRNIYSLEILLNYPSKSKYL
jgi:hypothetical protein